MTDPSTPAIPFDPTDAAFLADPYPAYHFLRQLAPILWVEAIQSWVVPGYADVAAGLRSPRLGVDEGLGNSFRAVAPTDPRVATLAGLLSKQLLFRDPPEHTRLRGLVNAAFTPRTVDRLRPSLEQYVADRLDRIRPGETFDLIRELAFPLPVVVIARMLGVPAEDEDRFTAWSRALTATLEPIVPAEDLYAANEATGEILEYFRALVARKRVSPTDDLLSALVHAEQEGRRLSPEELLANAVLMLVAGHETTVNLIGNGALALLEHPGQRGLLAREPALIESAVEEFLRYDSAVQMTSRVVREPVELAGRTIPAGQEVLFLLGSGNRDPARFPDPDRLDITRADNKHLSFGAGPHYCLGAPLARAEAQAALGALVRRFPVWERGEGEAVRRPSAVLRGLASLPVRMR